MPRRRQLWFLLHPEVASQRGKPVRAQISNSNNSKISRFKTTVQRYHSNKRSTASFKQTFNGIVQTNVQRYHTHGLKYTTLRNSPRGVTCEVYAYYNSSIFARTFYMYLAACLWTRYKSTRRQQSIFTRLMLARYSCARMILTSNVLWGIAVRVLLCASVVYIST